jgi:hypothetical protein
MYCPRFSQYIQFVPVIFCPDFLVSAQISLYLLQIVMYLLLISLNHSLIYFIDLFVSASPDLPTYSSGSPASPLNLSSRILLHLQSQILLCLPQIYFASLPDLLVSFMMFRDLYVLLPAISVYLVYSSNLLSRFLFICQPVSSYIFYSGSSASPPNLPSSFLNTSVALISNPPASSIPNLPVSPQDLSAF